MNPLRNSREVQVFDSHRPDAFLDVGQKEMIRSILLILAVLNLSACADREQEIVVIYGGTPLPLTPAEINSVSANMIVAYLVGEYYEKKGVWPSSEADLRRTADTLDWIGIDELFEHLRIKSFDESQWGIRVHYSVGLKEDRESGDMYMEGEPDRENGAQQIGDGNSVNALGEERSH